MPLLTGPRVTYRTGVVVVLASGAVPIENPTKFTPELLPLLPFAEFHVRAALVIALISASVKLLF